VNLNHAQLAHAAAIINTGSRIPGTNRDALVIALMAGLTESRLRMLANRTYPESLNYPNDGIGADHDSLGIFQMRHASGWGSIPDLMDPVYQARAFFGGPTGPNYPSPRGLLDIRGWQTKSKGAAAQAVEVSAYPDRYATWEPVAEAILNTLTNSANTGGGAGSTAEPDAGLFESRSVVFPLPAGTWLKTSVFGWRIHPITGLRNYHRGTDYRAPDGTPILAAADGVVEFAGPMRGFGNAIIIKHKVDGQILSTVYGHMWSGHLYVVAGDQVVAGQHIADVGSAGDSTGPHLHFQVHPTGWPAPPIDSNAWLASHGAASLDGPSATANGCTF